MSTPIVLIRRQSPDWGSLSRDYRNGVKIDPSRFVPDHEIPGFPRNIRELIETWNARFPIDFFTCRHVIADLSRQNVESVRGARTFDCQQLDAVADLARQERFFVFFHDDDDFFAPDLGQTLAAAELEDVDTVVFPLFRVAADLLTFVRNGETSEYIWGRREPFGFRFQTNNYGINSRICSAATLAAMKDHVLASSYANERRLSEKIVPSIVSATVKTPCSASVLPILLDENDSALREHFQAFTLRFCAPDLPATYSWVSEPLRQIAALLTTVYGAR